MKKDKIKSEKEVIRKMINIYCKWNNEGDGLCSACNELLDYACERLDRCPFGQNKPTCKLCTVHCYKPGMQRRIREVMRFSGPRMLFYYPVTAIRHLLKEKRRPTPLP